MVIHAAHQMLIMLIHNWRTIKRWSEDSTVSRVKPDDLKAVPIVFWIELNKYVLY